MTMTKPTPADAEDRWAYLLRTWQEMDVPEGYRAEIREGGIVLMPPPNVRHNLVADLIQEQLYRQIPRGYGVFQTLGIAIPHLLRLRIPDLVVARRADIRKQSGTHVDASDALLVVEIVSPTEPETDRLVKRQEYAKADIPLYMLIDAYDGTGTVTRFSDPQGGEYAGNLRTPFGRNVQVPEPLTLTIDTSEFE